LSCCFAVKRDCADDLAPICSQLKLLHIFLIRPQTNDSFRKDLCFTAEVFLNLFISPPESDSFRIGLRFAGIYFSFFFSRNLRAPWADRREILHDARVFGFIIPV